MGQQERLSRQYSLQTLHRQHSSCSILIAQCCSQDTHGENYVCFQMQIPKEPLVPITAAPATATPRAQKEALRSLLRPKPFQVGQDIFFSSHSAIHVLAWRKAAISPHVCTLSFHWTQELCWGQEQRC